MFNDTKESEIFEDVNKELKAMNLEILRELKDNRRNPSTVGTSEFLPNLRDIADINMIDISLYSECCLNNEFFKDKS